MSSLATHSPRLSGTTFCIISALAYSVANICLRRLSELHCDPMWAICVKEAVSVVIVGPWILWETVHGRKTLPDRFTLFLLIAVGLLTELVGNVSWQWAVGVIGIAATVPASNGVSLTFGAILGWVFMKERVSGRSAIAIGVLWAALVMLGVGVESAQTSPDAAAGTGSVSIWEVWGVLAAVLSGIVFGILGVSSCYTVRRSVPPRVIGFWIMLMAVISLGPLSVARLGIPTLVATSSEQWILMLVAGVFNLIGYMALCTGMHRTTLVHANVTNASQVAVAAVAGMLLFHEPPNLCVLLGIFFTILGILGIGQPVQDKDEELIGSLRV